LHGSKKLKFILLFMLVDQSLRTITRIINLKSIIIKRSSITTIKLRKISKSILYT